MKSASTVAIATMLAFAFGASVSAQTPDGARLYRDNCASCHDAGADRAPSREGLRALSAERVLAAMDSGIMVTMASRIGTAAERRAVAEFVAGKPLGEPLKLAPPPQAMCAGAPAQGDGSRIDATRLPSPNSSWN